MVLQHTSLSLETERKCASKRKLSSMELSEENIRKVLEQVDNEYHEMELLLQEETLKVYKFYMHSLL